MSPAYALRSAIRGSARVVPGVVPFERPVLIQIALAVVPAMAAVAAGKPGIGTLWCLLVLFTSLVINTLHRNPLAVSAVMIGVLPTWMLLRNSFFYSAIEICLGLCVFAWVEGRMSDFKALWKDRLVQYFFIVIAVYWATAFFITHDYAANSRGFELAFTGLNVALLAKHRRWLATALMGVAISVMSMGFGLLPYGGRLGMVREGAVRLGNPISFGIPASLILLVSIADGGRWILLQGRPRLRSLIQLVVGVLLVLSTSRGSWLVLIVGAVLIFVANPRQRKVLLAFALGLVLAVAAWIHFANSDLLTHYLDETFSPGESWGKRTTGRSEQWAAFPKVIHDSPVWGFGPGVGRRISVLYAHKNIIWHSIYLQVGAETGLLGLGLLAVLLGALIRRGWKHYRLTREIIPLIGVMGFMTIGISVPAFDGMSGIFLGLALMGCDRTGLWVVRKVVPAPA